MNHQILHLGRICVVCAMVTLTACGSHQPQAVPVLPVARTQSDANPSGLNSGDDDVAPTVAATSNSREPTDEVLERVTGSTVRVLGNDFTGSGVVLGQDQQGRVYVLTVWHGAREHVGRIELYSITSSTYPRPCLTLSPVEVVSKSPRRDLAVLRTARWDGNIEVPCLNLSAQGTPSAPVFSCGCADGPPILLPESIDEVVEARRPGQNETTKMWKTELPQEVGRSGGPLINLNGEIIGIALGRGGNHGYYCHWEEIARYFVDSNLNSVLECGTSGKDSRVK